MDSVLYVIGWTLTLIAVLYGVAILARGPKGIGVINRTVTRPLIAAPFLVAGHLLLRIGRSIRGTSSAKEAGRHQ